MIRRVVLACTALAFGLCFAATERLADYGAVAPVTPAPAPDGLQRVHLPLQVLQHSRADMADLRLFNGAGESLPIARFIAPPQPVARTSALPFFAWPQAERTGATAAALRVQVDAAGAVVRIAGQPADRKASGPARLWLLDLSSRKDAETLTALRLDWNASSSQSAKASVEGSDDLQSWQVAGHGTLLALASALPGAPPITQKRLPLQGRWKYLRLRLDEPLPLTAIEAEWQAAATPIFDRARIRFDDASAGGDPAWQADLQAALDLKQMRIELAQPNTVLLLQLEQRRHADAAWQPVGTHTVYRLVRQGEEIMSPPIDIAAPGARYWRIKLDRRSPRLAAASLEADLSWPRQELVFAARAPQPFTLAIARSGAIDATLPLATLLPGYKPGDEQALPAATMGAVSTQAPVPRSLSERLRDAPPEERRRWVLWVVLGLAVLGLAWLARRLMKEMAAS